MSPVPVTLAQSVATVAIAIHAAAGVAVVSHQHLIAPAFAEEQLADVVYKLQVALFS